MGGRKEPSRQRAALRSRSRGSGERTAQPRPPGGSIDLLWRAAGGVAQGRGVVRGVTRLGLAPPPQTPGRLRISADIFVTRYCLLVLMSPSHSHLLSLLNLRANVNKIYN